MKRLLCCIVVSAMLLTSCISNTVTHSSNMSSTEESTQESQVEESTQKEYVRPEIDVPKPDDEEGTLYFTCKNWNTDIHLMDSWRREKEFYIVSLNPLNMEEIEITVPIQNDYIVQVTPVELEQLKMTDYNVTEDYTGSPHTFPFYIYQSYRGMDWKKMRELYDSIEDADRLLHEEIISYDEYSKMTKDYMYYQDLYKEDYEALTIEDLPTFYLYHVSIWFGVYTTEYDEYGFTKEFEFNKMEDRVTETFHTIDIQIGDTIYTEEIGEVRLIAEWFSEEMYDRNGIEVTHHAQGSGKIPYGDGIILMNPAGFIAEEDLTINELYLYENHMTPLMAYVQIKDERGKILIDSKWDLQSPIYLEKGQKIEMRLIVQDENVMQLNYGGRCMAFVSYTVNGEDGYYFFEQAFDSELERHHGYWVVYASVFGGLSETLADYFYYYYPLYEDWRVGLE